MYVLSGSHEEEGIRYNSECKFTSWTTCSFSWHVCIHKLFALEGLSEPCSKMGNEKKRNEEQQFVGQLDAILASASGVELTNAIPNPPAIRAPIIARNLRIKL
jgi:hypothetical protein